VSDWAVSYRVHKRGGIAHRWQEARSAVQWLDGLGGCMRAPGNEKREHPPPLSQGFSFRCLIFWVNRKTKSILGDFDVTQHILNLCKSFRDPLTPSFSQLLSKCWHCWAPRAIRARFAPILPFFATFQNHLAPIGIPHFSRRFFTAVYSLNYWVDQNFSGFRF
jgi:hypothetical protein